MSIQKLLTNVFLSFMCVIFSIYASYATGNTTNAIIPYYRQNKILKNKKIWSEKHRQKYRKTQLSSKRIKKKFSHTSQKLHTRISGIIVKGNRNIATSEIKSITRTYLKKNITQKNLNLLNIAIENLYLKKGYLLPVVHTNLTNSQLKISLIEGKINNVLVMLGDKDRDKKVLDNPLVISLVNKIKRQDPTKTKDLERYIGLINDIPGYTVEYNLELLPEIQENKVADLLITVNSKMNTGELSVDNNGTSNLGKYQFDFVGQSFNLIENDSLTLNFATTDKPTQTQMVAGSYLKQLNSYGTSASVIASYSRYDPYHLSGSKYSMSSIFRGEINQYLLLNNSHSARLILGIEHRNVAQYEESNKLRNYYYNIGSVSGEIKIDDVFGGKNLFFPSFNFTLQNIYYKNDSTQVRNFDKNFNYLTIHWNREQTLPKNLSLFLEASYQYTNKLLPAEHLYSITTRGYQTGIVYSDQGISGNVELRYTNEFQSAQVRKFLKRGQIFVFHDITHLIKHNKTSQRKHHLDSIYFNQSTLSSIGLGIRTFLLWHIYAECTGEFPMRKNITVDGITHKNSPLYKFMISKEFNW